MKLRKHLTLAMVAGIAITSVISAAPASAEPVANGYSLVGSDTLQDSLNAITNGTSVSGAFVRTIDADGVTLGNFDAFGSATIQAKSQGPFFVRPSGSGNGRNALIASIKGTAWQGTVITDQVDIARSSDGPGSNENVNGQLAYLPYGRDAVSYAYIGGNGTDLANLTTAQLKSIYEASGTTTIGTTTVKPLLPQSGSGTRKFFLSAIGVATPGASDQATTTLAENDASVLKAAYAADASVAYVIPFSAASWIAQVNNASGVNTVAGSNTSLGSINGTAAFTGTGTSLTPNAAFYSSSFGRDTYLIVEYARIVEGAKYDPTLAALLDPSNALSLTNVDDSPASVGAVKAKFGFLKPSSSALIRAYATI